MPLMAGNCVCTSANVFLIVDCNSHACTSINYRYCAVLNLGTAEEKNVCGLTHLLIIIGYFKVVTYGLSGKHFYLFTGYHIIEIQIIIIYYLLNTIFF